MITSMPCRGASSASFCFHICIVSQLQKRYPARGVAKAKAMVSSPSALQMRRSADGDRLAGLHSVVIGVFVHHKPAIFHELLGESSAIYL